jgi:hypothetical protein
VYRKPLIRTVTVLSGLTESDLLELGVYTLVGIVTPVALTSSSITFKGCDTRTGTFVPVYDDLGNQVNVIVAASRAIGVAGAKADVLAAFDYLKIVCGSAEGADRTILVVLK